MGLQNVREDYRKYMEIEKHYEYLHFCIVVGCRKPEYHGQDGHSPHATCPNRAYWNSSVLILNQARLSNIDRRLNLSAALIDILKKWPKEHENGNIYSIPHLVQQKWQRGY